jgi:hypothetical protein
MKMKVIDANSLESYSQFKHLSHYDREMILFHIRTLSSKSTFRAFQIYLTDDIPNKYFVKIMSFLDELTDKYLFS